MFKSPGFIRLATGSMLVATLASTAFGAEVETLALNPDTSPSASAGLEISRRGEFGIEVGALTFVGTDLHLFYRLTDSPWMIGYRYLDFEDDFISFDSDNTDKETQTLAGPFVRYLFSPGRSGTWYLAGAIYRATQKIECSGLSDEDTARGPFFGGGLMGRRDGFVSYNVGLMFAPAMSLDTDIGICSSESDGGIDGVLSLMFVFN